MPASFSIGPSELLIWALVGLVGGLVGGMVVRGGAIQLSDALIGVAGALIGGIATEFFGRRVGYDPIRDLSVAPREGLISLFDMLR